MSKLFLQLKDYLSSIENSTINRKVCLISNRMIKTKNENRFHRYDKLTLVVKGLSNHFKSLNNI